MFPFVEELPLVKIVRTSTGRRLLFRCSAVLLGLLPFTLLELVCRVGGWGESVAGSAFAEFESVRPLFVADESTGLRKIAPNRREFFAHDEFHITKARNTFRIFVFGGSTVQGRPFSIPTSFPTCLNIALRQACPEVDWEVINCGGISYASYRLLPILRECLEYAPDLYIVCTGHNEFLECITYADVRRSSGFLKQSYAALQHSHGFRLLSTAFRSPTSPRLQLPTEVDAILDHRDGLEAYHRDALNRRIVARQFAANLSEMVTISKSAAVPLIFVKPPGNLRDCPPFKSQFGDRTSTDTRTELRRGLRDAAAANNKSTSALQAAVELDPEFAFAWYQLGHALLANGFPNSALDAFVQARDEDVCPLRMTSELEAAFDRISAGQDVPLIDAHLLLAGFCKDGIVDDSVLVDHVHPSFVSNGRIAVAIVEQLHEMRIVEQLTPEWKQSFQTEFEEHLQSLDSMYFLRGRRTLESLRAWTQGRAEGPPLNDRE